MPVYNPLYTRKWTKMFTPISSWIHQLGKQLGLSTTSIRTTHENDISIDMNRMSNGHTMKISDDKEFHPSNHSWSSYLSTLVSSTRLHPSSGRSSRPIHSKYYQKLVNIEENPSNNDENNNNQAIPTTTDELNSKSMILDLSSPIDDCSNNDTNEDHIFTTEHYFSIFFFTILYFTWFIFIAGISIVHLIIYLILIMLYFLSTRTRRFALATLIYLSFLFLYDSLHLIPNYTISQVHIEDVYLLEKKIFGVVSQGQILTLNEYFKIHHQPLLDIFTGICYLNWIPIPLVYSLYLYRYKNKRDYMDFAFTFLLTNVLGFVVYYIVPAAPPWYVEMYGFTMNVKAPGHPAGFQNFDRLTGLKIFSMIYSKNANVFAALPSLHAAYPVLTVLYGSLSKKLWLHIGFVLFTLSVWFSAVYSRHHYVLDVLAGGTCAITAYILYRILSRLPSINKFLTAYSKSI